MDDFLVTATVTDGSPRTGREDLLRRDRDRGGIAAIEEATETGAEARGVEAISEGTVLDGEARLAKETNPSDMVELKTGAQEETDGPTRGKHLEGWDLCSGPHWPLPGTATTAEPGRLRSRTRWFTGTRPRRPPTPSEGQEAPERTCAGLAGTTFTMSEMPMHRPEADLSLDLMLFRSSARRTKD